MHVAAGQNFMTSIFYVVCAASLTFFVVFFVGCSTPRRTRRKVLAVHKLPQFEAADSVCGRRFLAHRRADGRISALTEELKKVTATYDFTIANGFEIKYEYRRDWSNVAIFLASTQNVFSKDQNTATVGVIWWFVRKQVAWSYATL